MGKPSRDKGYRVEREMVLKLQAEGIGAERVPLSGGAGGSYTGDIIIRKEKAGQYEELRAEVKARKNGEGFKTLEDWLGENDCLILKRNHAEPMVVLPWEQFVELMR
jgi:hypothetical protein